MTRWFWLFVAIREFALHTMFFLMGLVVQGYYYTFFSLACATVVGRGALVPTRHVLRLGCYWIFLAVEFLGLYFLIVSVIYWIDNSAE